MRLPNPSAPRLLLLALAVTASAAAAQPPASDRVATAPATSAVPSDLDVLMERVLKNRDQAWRRLQEYLLAERETFRLEGPDGAPMFGSDRDFLWVAREGRAIRSPVRVNGVAIGEDERRREEAKWQKEEDERAERAAKRTADATTSPGEMEAALRGREPRFISEVQFLRFRFEPGNYYFVGRETLAGREVLRIEYYPRRLFADADDRHEERDRARQEAAASGKGERGASDRAEEEIERALNKVSLVTLWIDPAVDQVVRYTFDNVDFNFLPGRSLVRVDTAKATMTMSQPFPGVWLPESLAIEGALTLATGTYRAEYARRFTDYRQADVQMRFRVKDDK
jgi:hypothetical protein